MTQELKLYDINEFNYDLNKPHDGAAWSMCDVATKEELLEYANKIRASGGAELLPSLLPSEPVDSSSCLIANALNFNSSVNPDEFFLDSNDDQVEYQWQMSFNGTKEQAQKLQEAEIGDVSWYETMYAESSQRFFITVKLPRHIGNAAHAFDQGAAFTEYRIS